MSSEHARAVASIAIFSTLGSGSRDEARIVSLTADLNRAIWPFDHAHKRRSAIRLVQRLRRERPDVVVMEDTSIAGGAVVLLGRFVFRVPYVVSSGDAVGPFIKLLAPKLGLFGSLYEIVLCRFSAGFIGWTPYLVGRALTMGAPRAVTAANWAPPQDSNPDDRAAIRDRLGISSDAIVFGLVGSLIWADAVRYCYGLELVRAIARSTRSGRPRRAPSATATGRRRRLEEEAGSAPGVRVHLTGRVAREDLGKSEGGRLVEVAVTTIDRLTTPYDDRVALVKLDVEGAELKALRGSVALIKRSWPLFLIEVEPEHLARQGSSVDELMILLKPHGYEAYGITSTACLVPIDGPWLPLDPSCPNLVLASPSRLKRAHALCAHDELAETLEAVDVPDRQGESIWARERDFHDALARQLDVDALSVNRQPGPLDHVMLDLAGDLRGLRILDAGCGQGDLTLHLLQQGANVTALDVSPGMIEVVRSRASRLPDTGGQLATVAAPLEQSELPDASFDLVLGKYILHHIDVSSGALELRRVLRPGGRAIFIENAGDNRLLIFARDRLAGRWGIPRLGTEDEHPLTAGDIAGLRGVFSRVVAHYPVFEFLVLFDRQVLRFKSRRASRIIRGIDNAVHRRIPRLRRYSYRVIVELEV